MREEKWRPDRTSTPEGWLRRGRVSHAWRDPQGLRSQGSGSNVSLTQSAREGCPNLCRILNPQRSPPGWVGPGGIGGRLGENRRGRREEPSRTRGAGKEQRVFASPTWALEACWAPRWAPPPSETRGGRHTWGPSVLLSLRLTPTPPKPPHTPPPHLFEPCGS